MFGTELEYSGESLDREQLLILTFLLRYDGATQEVYRYRLKIFYQWCQQNNLDMIDGVKRVHLDLYVRYLRESRGNKSSSIVGALGTLRTFYEMLEIDDIIIKSPARNVILPKIHQSDIKRPHLNRTQFTNLFEYCKTQGVSDSCMILMLGVMGLRVSELCGLDISSISYFEQGHRLIKFIGKGSKPASLPMPILVLRELDTYLQLIDRDNGPLFLGGSGERLSRRSAYRRVRTLTRNAPGVPEVGPHALRRSMITNSLNAGADIREVQKSARHSDLRTTSRVYDQGTPSYDSNSFNILAGYVAGAI